MADDQHRALVLLQRLLQPLGGLKVEVVRRLVQQQQIGLGQQQPRQAQAGLFAAGEHPRGLILAALGEAQTRQHALDAAGPLVAAGGLEAIQQVGIAAAQAGIFIRVLVLFGHLGLQRAQALLHLLQWIEHALQLLLHGQVALDVGLLRQQPHARTLDDGDAALVRLHRAGDQPKQRGLARAVRANQPHAAARLEREAHVLQHGVHREGLGDVLYGQKYHRITPMGNYSAHQRPLAPQGSTPPQVTGSTISSAATRPPWVRPTVMVSMLFSTAG